MSGTQCQPHQPRQPHQTREPHLHRDAAAPQPRSTAAADSAPAGWARVEVTVVQKEEIAAKKDKFLTQRERQNPQSAPLGSCRPLKLRRSSSEEATSKTFSVAAPATAAVAADPEYIKGLYRQANALLALGRPTEAARVAATGLSKQPNNVQMRELLARARVGAARKTQ